MRLTEQEGVEAISRALQRCADAAAGTLLIKNGEIALRAFEKGFDRSNARALPSPSMNRAVGNVELRIRLRDCIDRHTQPARFSEVLQHLENRGVGQFVMDMPTHGYCSQLRKLEICGPDLLLLGRCRAVSIDAVLGVGAARAGSL
jgi:hypothetical protein